MSFCPYFVFFLLKNYGIAVFSESIKSHPPDSRAWFNFLFSLLSFCITKLSMTISHFCQWCTVIYVLSIHVAIYISHSPFNRLVMTFQERERNVLATPTCLWLFSGFWKHVNLSTAPSNIQMQDIFCTAAYLTYYYSYCAAIMCICVLMTNVLCTSA